MARRRGQFRQLATVTLACMGLLAPSAQAQTQRPTFGERPTVVILLSSGAQVNRFTPDQAREAVFGGTYNPGLFWSQASQGAISLPGLNDPNGDVIGPVDIGDVDPCDDDTLRDAADEAVEAMGTDLGDYLHTIYVTWPAFPCGINGKGGGKWAVIYDNDEVAPIEIRPHTLAHEIGHGLGFGHAGVLNCTDASGQRVAISDTCTFGGQGDQLDVLGRAEPELEHGRLPAAPRLYSNGWMVPSQVRSITEPGIYSLDPLMSDGATRALRIDRPGDDRDYWIETRQPFAPFDDFEAGRTSGLAASSLQIRLYPDAFDTQTPFTYLIDTHPESPSFRDAPLQVGEQFVDPQSGVVVKLLSIVAGTGQAIVEIDPSGASTAAERVVDVAITSSADDAEERTPDRVVDLGDDEIQLGDDPAGNGDQTAGLRFTGVAVPEGATITSARLSFVSEAVATDRTTVEIRAEAADSAQPFTATSGNLTARERTAAAVQWTMSAWDSRAISWRSPDLSALVQEVVDRDGWTSGGAMAFLTDGQGTRAATAWDEEPGEAARLQITYVLPGDIPDDPATTVADVLDPDPVDAAITVSGQRFSAAGTAGDSGRRPAAHAVLARVDVFADALTGSVLTGDAPILFTGRDALDDRTAAELQRILGSGGTVYLLGGEAALSRNVESAIAAAGLTAARLAGQSRVETSIAVAQQAKILRGEPDTIAIARATAPDDNPSAGWVDAIGAGAWAARTGNPILLTPTSSLHPDVLATVNASSARRVVLGGGAAISPDVSARLQAGRVQGADRFSTAAAVATGLSPDATGGYVIANGTDPDGWAFALIGAGLGADLGRPLLLSQVSQVPAPTESRRCATGTAAEVTLVGPTTLLSDTVRDSLRSAC